MRPLLQSQVVFVAEHFPDRASEILCEAVRAFVLCPDMKKNTIGQNIAPVRTRKADSDPELSAYYTTPTLSLAPTRIMLPQDEIGVVSIGLPPMYEPYKSRVPVGISRLLL